MNRDRLCLTGNKLLNRNPNTYAKKELKFLSILGSHQKSNKTEIEITNGENCITAKATKCL